ncbi:MAG: arginine repressor [Clostridia bacterium]|nr:arginine repressor [Clostridia bacterium]
MKNARQMAILSIIEKDNIETQEELAAKLRDIGIVVTQATVSRDIKELRLLKVLTPDGSYKYATVDKAEHGVSERLVRMFIDSVLSISYAENLIVVRTLPGSANAAGEAIDSMRWPEVLGTISGDNTIFVAVRSAAEAPVVVEKFQEILKR